MVSSGCSTVRTEKASAEDTRRRECPHDVVGLYAHKGTMWMSSEDPLRCCFQLRLPCLPRDLSWALGGLPDSLAYTVVDGGPVVPEVNEPLALLVLDHADLAG